MTTATADAAFVGSAVSAVMASVQAGEVRQRTGMDEVEAYAALADLVMEGLTVST
ncbi:hypothetical protein [Nocardioides panzhihuensis]|uniref:TetR family transcriptional regulator n=1 Tax=Nocardioides panzhihuensis TaxID=860243 RepID=A0A7Z0IRE5_9ACTN|nr:hypothetical protein [Nocardioides panzhihuensis]NYI76715.1 hypothetical protein [Nocardioides panzhihuensis]